MFRSPIDASLVDLWDRRFPPANTVFGGTVPVVATKVPPLCGTIVEFNQCRKKILTWLELSLAFIALTTAALKVEIQHEKACW